MWLFNLLPNFVFHFAIVIGTLAFLASTLLPFIPNKTPIQLISVIVLCFGVWGQGIMTSEHVWKEKVLILEKKLAQKETESVKTNIVIQKEYVDRIKTVTEIKWKVKTQIVEKEKIIDANCVVPPEAINILNEAAK